MNLLFLCAKNDARSQMAEAFARARRLADITMTSAGYKASSVHPLAVRVMAEIGIDISAAAATPLTACNEPVDVVISFSERPAGAGATLVGRPEWIDWQVSDPAAVTGDDGVVLSAFRESRDRIRALVNAFWDDGYGAAIRESRVRTDAIFDCISDGIIVHTLDGRITYVNRAAEAILDGDASAITSRRVRDVLPGGVDDDARAFHDTLASCTTVQRHRMAIATGQGQPHFVHVTVSPLLDAAGVRYGGVVVLRDLRRHPDVLHSARTDGGFAGIIGRHESMLAIFEMIRELADAKVPVLIQGESGTGKELVAAAIHQQSKRCKKLFVPVNCGALPESLLESELFGHVKGAFTGASRDKKGRFELADGGTIFLDEVGDITPAMQVKLLRVLQEGTFERVGGEETISVDVRVISATNKDLSEELADGRFREDLFYRLSVVPLTLPPLRDRRSDIPALVDAILAGIAQDVGRPETTLSDGAMEILMAHNWPGNVRELQNWLQFAMVKCHSGCIGPEHLPAGGTPREPSAPRHKRRKLDATAVRDALQASNGNKVEAAKRLGVSRATLYRFLDDDEDSD
ncbi:MAG: sigma 54-interacting transcriptional regulator [Verrucomicrobia bacterium]|nr:sigma 54-interacting transcriptional regulator [Verrucomicrobiota bacterium]